MTEKKLVLIVDDEAFNRDIAARLVKRMGHTSIEFDRGQKVIDALQEHEPDLILLDIHMPEMNGLQVLKEIRQSKEKSDLPILMITADSDPDSVVEAFEIGANDYVTKPINSKTLRSRIDTHLQLSDATKQIKDFAEGAERLVEKCTIDLQRQNEELAREVKLRMEMEEILLDQKLTAERENKAKSEFLAILTHELKTPLNISIGFADLIADDANNQMGLEQCREYATYISNSSNQLLSIVEDILMMSSYDIGNLSIKENNVSILMLIEDAIGRAKPSPQEKDIQIILDCPEELTLICDHAKLCRVFSNLISNAVKFSPSGTTCHITAEILDTMEISVVFQDEGVGISSDDLDKIMQPYQQNSAGLDRSHEGLGLGLPVARAILDLHDASLEFSSELEKGTMVSVKFPQERTFIQTTSAAERTA